MVRDIRVTLSKAARPLAMHAALYRRIGAGSAVLPGLVYGRRVRRLCAQSSRSSQPGSCSSMGARPCCYCRVSGVSRRWRRNMRIALARSSRYQRSRCRMMTAGSSARPAAITRGMSGCRTPVCTCSIHPGTFSFAAAEGRSWRRRAPVTHSGVRVHTAIRRCTGVRGRSPRSLTTQEWVSGSILGLSRNLV